VADYTLTQQAQTDSYTLVLGDANKLVEVNKATAATVTIPLNSSVAFPVGTQIHILQVGAGQVTIAGTGGVTVDGKPGLKIIGQWRMATLIKRGTNTWVAVGGLAS
jgi:citrate lyase gamma subunit